MILVIYDRGDQIAVHIPDTDEPLWLLAQQGKIIMLEAAK